MTQKKQKTELERKLHSAFLLLSTLVILLSLGVTLYYDVTRQKKDTDAIISGTAAYIAMLPGVMTMLEEGYPDPQVKQAVDSLCDTIPDINVAVICDKNGLRFYHTDRQKTGDSYLDGDEKQILEGSAPYVTTGYGSKGNQRRAFHAIAGADGKIIGYVMVSVFSARLTARHRSILLVHFCILGVMLLASVVLTNAILRSLRKSLMGFQPEELLRRYLRQDEVLGAVEEGLVASNPQGIIIFANHAAVNFFPDTETLVGMQVQELFPDTCQATIIETGNPEHRRSWIINGHTVLANEIPIHTEDNKVQGVLTILFDKTEMLRVSDELFGARSMLDALRSFNHEFSNKLHVILGYLETGQTQQAIRFIVNSNLVSGQLICQTAELIRNSELCALVIGKMMHAAELGILLNLAGDSCCIEQDMLLPVDDWITLTGNLLENAIEELSGSDREIKEIKLGIYCRPDCNILVCEDTGGGIRPEVADHIFEKNVSTKGQTHGMGLYLVQRIVKANDGKIEIDTEPGEGTCFTLTFTREEKSHV